MKSFKSQNGMSFLGWLIVLGIAGASIVAGMRLIPIYLESYTVSKILEDVALEYRDKQTNKNRIWSSISKRLDVNSIDGIKIENFSYIQEKGKVLISLKYEMRTKLVGNLDGVASFEYTQAIEAAHES
jgi:Domain of unknown function (DUF4845)